MLACIGLLAATRIGDPDAMQYLASGRLILTRGLDYGCVFSYASDQCQFVYPQWLFHVATYGVYRVLGWNALVALKIAIAVSVFGVILLHHRRKTVPPLATIGLILLALEVLVIPGFGLAGALGILAIVASLVLSLVGPGFSTSFLLAAAGRVVFALLFALAASLVLLRFLPRLPFGRQLVLDRGLAADQGYASAPQSDAQWLGKTGRASSPLHPAGIAEIDGRRVDVVSEGELIDAGQAITVIRVDGNRVVVRNLSDSKNINQKE